MQRYIDGLLADIEKKILDRWNDVTPHFYRPVNPIEPSIIPPDGWVPQKEARPSPSIEAHLKEVDDWLEGKGAQPMYVHFDIQPEAFPDSKLLTDQQLSDLVKSIMRLWIAHNFLMSFPDGLPDKMAYSMLLEHMHKDYMLQNQGVNGIDFCEYHPPDCPFGAEYCTCAGFEYEEFDGED